VSRLALVLALLLALLAAAAPAWCAERITSGDLARLIAEAGAGRRPVLVNFWATWCSPCRKEIPELKKVRAAFAEADLAMLGVSFDLSAGSFEKFVARAGFGYPQHLAEEELMSSLEIRAIPRTVIYGPDGALARVWEGPVSAEDLSACIRGLAAGPAKGGS
jgi:thiol-disulfide isomerase/thioredoxin